MAQNANNNADNTVAEVDSALSKTEQFVETNKKNIAWFLAVVVIIVAGGWFWIHQNSKKNVEAQNAIYEAQFLFESGNYEAALPLLEAVVDESGSTTTGNLAKAYMGLCQKELGNYEEAIAAFKSFSGTDKIIAPAIEAALGDCYVETDDYKSAVKCFEKAAAAANNEVYSPLYLKKAGLAYEAMGDKASAAKMYNEIKESWLTTEIGQSIDKYLYRVQ